MDGEEKKHGLPSDYSASTVTDTEFDLVEELKGTLDDVEKALQQSRPEEIPGKISYMKFLLHELDDNLSGDYEDLRRKRFITKQST